MNKPGAKHVLTRAPRKNVGDAVGDWTVIELHTDGPNANFRRWVIQCKCGYKALRWETDLKRALSACATCAAKK